MSQDASEGTDHLFGRWRYLLSSQEERCAQQGWSKQSWNEFWRAKLRNTDCPQLNPSSTWKKGQKTFM